MNKTAVEWLVDHLKEYGFDFSHHEREIEQAKEMEKQQIIEAYCFGCKDIIENNEIFPRETSEQYYNETYKKERK